VTLPGITFVDDYLSYLESAMDTPIVRCIHPNTLGYFQSLIYQSPESSAVVWAHRDRWPPKYWFQGVSAKIRADLNLPANTWTGYGIRVCDSLMRRFVLQKYGPLDHAHLQFKPIWDWTLRQVTDIIAESGVKLPVDYRLFGRSWENYDEKYLRAIRQHFPADYQRIKKFFPMTSAQHARYYFAAQRAARTKEARNGEQEEQGRVQRSQVVR